MTDKRTKAQIDKRTKAQIIEDYEKWLKMRKDDYHFLIKRHEAERIEWRLQRKEHEMTLFLQSQVLEIVAALNPEADMSKNSIKLIAQMAYHSMNDPYAMTTPHIREYLSKYKKVTDEWRLAARRIRKELSDGDTKLR